MWVTSNSHDHAGPRNNPLKGGKKKNPSWASPCRIGKSHPRGRSFNQGRGKPRPWLKFLPLGWDFPILHGHSWWILKSHSGTLKIGYRLSRCWVGGGGGGAGAHTAWQTSLLHMKILNKTKSPLFVICACVCMCLCFQRQFFRFYCYYSRCLFSFRHGT